MKPHRNKINIVYDILNGLDRFKPISKSVIATKANLGWKSLTQKLNALEEKGMIQSMDGKVIDIPKSTPYIITDKGAIFRESLKQYVE